MSMTITLTSVTGIPDVPAFRALLLEYYETVRPGIRTAGGPDISAEDMTDATLADPSTLLPPDNRLILGHTDQGRLVACAALRRIRPDAVEMKRMFVRPEARGHGLGQRLLDMRLDEARAMGCRAAYADTYRGNRPMLSIYESRGFRQVPRYPENANPPEFAPFLVYLEYLLN
jgi:GNAT superfamily N-acetyltransferase